MAAPKATFTLDAETLATLRRIATRLNKPQSVVVREAIAQYDARADRLTQAEQRHMLGVVSALRQRRPTKAEVAAADAEITQVRKDRRQGGRTR